jgi:hypothetical protein
MSTQTPRVGDMWSAQGGIYAGIARGREGEPDYYLIVGPEIAVPSSWDDAIEWAKYLQVLGLGGFALPTRKELSICFANVPELFEEARCWSGEQHMLAGYAAWGQDFGGGYQDAWAKSRRLRAHAVRRAPLIGARGE